MESIHTAARNGDLATLNQLIGDDITRLNLKYQAPWVHYYSDHGCSPLMFPAMRGHDAVVERLLSLGADMSMHSHNGCTAADWALVNDHASTLALLLDAGAPLNASLSGGYTPLMYASQWCSVKCLKLLIFRGRYALCELLVPKWDRADV